MRRSAGPALGDALSLSIARPGCGESLSRTDGRPAGSCSRPAAAALCIHEHSSVGVALPAATSIRRFPPIIRSTAALAATNQPAVKPLRMEAIGGWCLSELLASGVKPRVSCDPRRSKALSHVHVTDFTFVCSVCRNCLARQSAAVWLLSHLS
jgi:hypothetical protein